MTPLYLFSYQAFGQAVQTLPLPEGELPIDIVCLKDHQVHLVTNRSIYLIRSNTLEKISSQDSIRITIGSQNFSSTDRHHFYNAIQGGFLPIQVSRQGLEMLSVTSQFSYGALLRDENTIWVGEENLYSNTPPNWSTHLSSKDTLLPYWDGCTQDESFWFSHYGTGVYRINDSDSITHYSSQDGLFSDMCCSIACDGNKILVGHRGGFSFISDEGIATQSMVNALGPVPILEIEPLDTTQFLFLTPQHLFRYDNENLAELRFPKSEGEECLAIHTDSQNGIWLLTTKNLHRLSQQWFEDHDFAGFENAVSNLYNIRGNSYFNNSEHVFGYNSNSNDFEIHINKVPPHDTYRDDNQDSYLQFANGNCMLIDGVNAKILDRFTVPENEIIHDIQQIGDDRYLCGRGVLYRKHANTSDFELIYNGDTEFFQVFAHNDDIYLTSDHGPYRLLQDSVLQLIPESIPGTYVATAAPTIYDVYILSPTTHGLVLFNTVEGDYLTIDLSPLTIRSTAIHDSSLLIVTDKSLASLSIPDLLDEEITFEGNIPLGHELLRPELHVFDDAYIWIKGIHRVMKCNLEDAGTTIRPALIPNKITTSGGYEIQIDSARHFRFVEKDLPLKIDFYNSSFWSAQPSYVYYLSGPINNTSEWQSEAQFEFDYSTPGSYMLNAKMKDEVMGEDIFSDTIRIDILKDNYMSSKTLLLIPLFLFFAVILGYFAARK